MQEHYELTHDLDNFLKETFTEDKYYEFIELINTINDLNDIPDNAIKFDLLTLESSSFDIMYEYENHQKSEIADVLYQHYLTSLNDYCGKLGFSIDLSVANAIGYILNVLKVIYNILSLDHTWTKNYYDILNTDESNIDKLYDLVTINLPNIDHDFYNSIIFINDEILEDLKSRLEYKVGLVTPSLKNHHINKLKLLADKHIEYLKTYSFNNFLNTTVNLSFGDNLNTLYKYLNKWNDDFDMIAYEVVAYIVFSERLQNPYNEYLTSIHLENVTAIQDNHILINTINSKIKTLLEELNDVL